MAFVIGVHQTAFRRDDDRTHAELAAEAFGGAVQDAGLDPADIDAVWFGSTTVGAWGQPAIAGPAVMMGIAPQGAPVISVEGACATGGLALHAAWLAVMAGQADLAVAIGVDRAPKDDVVGLLDGVTLVPGEWEEPPSRHDRERFGRRQARSVGDSGWQPIPERPLLLDVAALEARYGVRAGSCSRRDLAQVVAKSRAAGAENEHAWLRKPITAEEVQAEPMIVEPFTRSMGCALVSGGAAVVVASEYGLARLPSRARAVRVAGMAAGGGLWRGLGQRPALERVARRAFSAAHTTPESVDLAEVHDATAWAELKWLDALGLGSLSEVAAWTRGGETGRDGRLPVNQSGGLLSKGHALAATGLGQVGELVAQLRGEAGARQVRKRTPRVAVAHNGGGLVGFDDATSVVTVLRAE
ncbi:MAG: thiolase family protein [Myxococcota bacterium]